MKKITTKDINLLRKLDDYRSDFSNYISDIKKHDDFRKNRSTNVDYRAELFEVKLYKNESLDNKKLYVVVPSLFNSPNILDFSDDSSFIELLRSTGDVYLLHWKEVRSQFKLNDYAQETAKFLNQIYFSGSQKIILVGHCIGGNIAMHAAFRAIDKLESILLLTTPWDFSHLAPKVKDALAVGAFDAVRSLDIIPSLYVRTLFFLLFPEQFSNKLDKYFTSTKAERVKIMHIERWLHSGISLPSSLFFQIIEEVVIGNYFINASNFDLQKITCPILNIHAKKDRLAPMASSKSFLSQLPQVKSLLVQGGHISYLIDGNEQLAKKKLLG